MNKAIQNLVGWVLLVTGLMIILWSVFSSYNIFTGKSLSPEIFKMTEKENVLITTPKGKIPDPETQVQGIIGEQLKGLLPLETLPKFFNLISWSIFAGILILAGSQLAGLGIKLIKG